MANATDVLIGRNVRELRGERSQQALADFMRGRGMPWSQATVWSVEKGTRPVKLAEVEALAEFLGVPATALIVSDYPVALISAGDRVHKAWAEVRERVVELAHARAHLQHALSEHRAERGSALETNVDAGRALYALQHETLGDAILAAVEILQRDAEQYADQYGRPVEPNLTIESLLAELQAAADQRRADDGHR